MRSIMRKVITAALMGTVVVAGAAVAAQPSGQSKGKAGKTAAAQDEPKDMIIFRDGKVAEGKILEETDTTVKMRVVVAGISAETVYEKSRILQIQRAAKPAADPKTAEAPAATKAAEPERKPEAPVGKV